VALLTLPAAAGMFVLRRPLIGLTLQHGQFDAADALLTSRALAGFAVGLAGFSIYLFVLRCFYAHGDGRTPFVINVVENLLNIVIAVVLVRRYGVLGLGLAFALAYLVSSAWALQVLSYKVRGFAFRPTLVAIGRMLLASVVMAEVTWVVARAVGSNEGLGALTRVVVAGGAGLIAYVVVLVALGTPEVRDLRSRVIARFA
jgi:putative peptidoglycan lipid II flippase